MSEEDSKNLKEINVGHTLVSRALFIGLRAAVAEMKALMAAYQGDQE